MEPKELKNTSIKALFEELKDGKKINMASDEAKNVGKTLLNDIKISARQQNKSPIFGVLYGTTSSGKTHVIKGLGGGAGKVIIDDLFIDFNKKEEPSMYLPYTGVGSRNTPEEVQITMRIIGQMLAENGYTLRSGASAGADTAFEQGCGIGNGAKEIYLPWKQYRKHLSPYYETTREAYKTAEQIHPNWNALKTPQSRKLMARNSHQVLGVELNNTSKFLIVYTTNGKKVGGSAQAIRLAEKAKIPIYNLGKMKTREVIKVIRAQIMSTSPDWRNNI